MDVSYTPLDPGIWTLFAVFCFFTWLIVRIYRGKYPEYPGKSGEDKK